MIPMIAGTLLTTLVTEITKKLVQAPNVPVDRNNVGVIQPEIREAVHEAVVSNPVLVNELNGENKIQSRVLWGNAIAGIGSVLATFLPILVALGLLTEEDSRVIQDGWAALLPAIGGVMALGGVLYSTYGRLATGLKPLFSKK